MTPSEIGERSEADLGKVYLIPVEDVPSKSRATLRLTPPRNGQQSMIRWASDYLLTQDGSPENLLGPVPAGRSLPPCDNREGTEPSLA